MAPQKQPPGNGNKQLLSEIEAQRNLMIAVATGGLRIQMVNEEYTERQRRIHQALSAMGIRDPNPYSDLWEWHGKWSSGDLPSYQSRRQYLQELFAPLVGMLTRGPLGPLREPTGMGRVDRCQDKIRFALAAARNEEDFQAVGLLCRETLVSLAQAIYDPVLHPSVDGVQPSKTDANRMLEAYIEHALAGGANEAMRRYAKAALSLANDLQHSRTADFRRAAMCTEATSSVVNLIAIVSGRRDPDSSS